MLSLGYLFMKLQSDHNRQIQLNISASTTVENANTSLRQIREELDAAYQKQYDPAKSVSQEQTQDSLNGLQIAESAFDQVLTQFQSTYLVTTANGMAPTYTQLHANPADGRLLQQQQDILRQVQSNLWPAYKTAIAQAVTAIDQKGTAGQVKGLVMAADTSAFTMEAMWAVMTQTTEQITASMLQVPRVYANPFTYITLIAALISMCIVLMVGYILYRTITLPLHQLTTLTKRISRGEMNARATIVGRDEIHQVALSMNMMLDTIVQLLQEMRSQRDNLQGQVERLVNEVSGVAEGDLRIQAEVTADSLGVLADSFNYMVEELGSLVVRVKAVTHEVEHTAQRIVHKMIHLVDMGKQQLGQIRAVNNGFEKMINTSRHIADRSQELYEVACIARQDVQTGRESVERFITRMERIDGNVQTTASKVQTLSERSKKIDEIGEAISGIAHQTNRLALDAAIQAAMAGEHGKGFGAVAADIRRLAERAKDQANMITHIVRSIREDIAGVTLSMQDTEQETRRGMSLTQEASIALESIFAAVEHQAHETEQINGMAMQQVHSANAVVQAMGEIFDSTQQGSQSTQAAAQNMERLVHQVEQLRSSVEVFKLRENPLYTAPHLATTSTRINTQADDEAENPLTVSGIFRAMNARNTKVPSTTPSAHVSEVQPSKTFPPLPESTSGGFVSPGITKPFTLDQLEEQAIPSSQQGNDGVAHSSLSTETPNGEQPA